MTVFFLFFFEFFWADETEKIFRFCFVFFSCRAVPLTSLWPTVRHEEEEEEVDAVISSRRLKLITAKMRFFTSVGSDFLEFEKLQGRCVSGGDGLTGKKKNGKIKKFVGELLFGR